MFDFVTKWRSLPRLLRERGVLGINARNGRYVLPNNPRKFYPRVDDKILTKEICRERGIPVPDTYGVISKYGDVRRLVEWIGRHNHFVIKPGKGSEGRGIIVIANRNGDSFVTTGGQSIALADLKYHVSTILAGLYSLGGQPDHAILEQRIVRHAVFENVAVDGTPDIRIILYRCVPVMAMIRLPTRASRGRANLHQGAVAAGIHLASGKTLGGVCKSRVVDAHPDTQASIVGLQVPLWNELLDAAMRLAEGLELGYVGVDFVLDAALGPIVLEANARPGLAIQVANRCGLRPRLRHIDAQPPERLCGADRLGLIAELSEVF